jgi:hypothetical protein
VAATLKITHKQSERGRLSRRPTVHAPLKCFSKEVEMVGKVQRLVQVFGDRMRLDALPG